ncbi:MAG: ester cyclase [Betaproteobacteria bacterium]|nr:ester cyclase [Betaproteobacteria bacterium]
MGAFKTRYLDALASLDRSGRSAWETALRPLFSPAVQWHGAHPVNSLDGCDALFAPFWAPLFDACPDLERHDDIVLDGIFKENHWIAATGHLTATFTAPWLGIPPSGGLLNIRYGEFSRVEDDRIVEVYFLFDLLDVMRQSGCWPSRIPNTRGPFPFAFHDRIPGPAHCHGVLGESAAGDAAAASKSLALVEAMIAGLMQYDGKTLSSMGMERFWHPQMMWYGPAGIGSCRRLKGFQDVHQRDFLAAFPDRRGGNHKCRIAQGPFVASTGWPSIRATHLGAWMGVPPSGRPITMRVMDFWFRDGETLRENWVFIDLPDLLLQMDVDVLDALK